MTLCELGLLQSYSNPHGIEGLGGLCNPEYGVLAAYLTRHDRPMQTVARLRQNSMRILFRWW